MPITFPAFALLSVIRSALRFRLISSSPYFERCQFMQLPVRLPQVRDRCKKAFTPIPLKGIPFKTHNFSDSSLFSVFMLYIYFIYIYIIFLKLYIVFIFLYKIFFSYFILQKRCNRQHSCKNKNIILRLSHLFFSLAKTFWTWQILRINYIDFILIYYYAIYRAMHNVIT